MQNNAIYSTMVRAGRSTYFIDVKEAKTGAKYISISEHRMEVDAKKSRSTIRVFGESIEQFRQAVNEAAESAKQ
jgi:3-hydroxymyristoyl/3-hydroxydecanoyl-(acyl carrier protein) dehydratase